MPPEMLWLLAKAFLGAEPGNSSISGVGNANAANAPAPTSAPLNTSLRETMLPLASSFAVFRGGALRAHGYAPLLAVFADNPNCLERRLSRARDFNIQDICPRLSTSSPKKVNLYAWINIRDTKSEPAKSLMETVGKVRTKDRLRLFCPIAR